MHEGKDEKAKASPSPSPVKRKITNTKEIISRNGGGTLAAIAASCPEDFSDHFNKDEDDLLQLAGKGEMLSIFLASLCLMFPT